MTTPPPAPIPPEAVLMQTIQGFMAARALVTVAELGVADALAGGPKSTDTLALELGVNANALHRLLRALASRGIFAEGADGRFENTPTSEPLRSDVPGSLRDYTLYALHRGNLRAWELLDDVVKSGEPSFEAANGEPLFTYMAKHPELAERFDRAMTSMSSTMLADVVSAYDFSRFRSIVDVGGGRGHVLAAMLATAKSARGVLFDQPHVLPRADALLAERGVRARCELVGGDFFAEIPKGHDAYVLKHILHDWDDARATAILKNVRAAIEPTGTLLVLDAIIAKGNAPAPAKWLDLQMMVVLGGRERTEVEHAALLGAADFRLERTVNLPRGVSILEAKPI